MTLSELLFSNERMFLRHILSKHNIAMRKERIYGNRLVYVINASEAKEWLELVKQHVSYPYYSNKKSTKQKLIEKLEQFIKDQA